MPVVRNIEGTNGALRVFDYNVALASPKHLCL